MKALHWMTLTLGSAALLTTACRQKPQQMTYPQTAKVDTVDVYFGTEVADPYRWLEDDNAPETKAWVAAQNQVTNEWFSQIPYRKDIADRLAQVWNYTSQGSPEQIGQLQFYFRHDGQQNHAVYYVKDLSTNEERVLIDPNLFSEDGTTSLASVNVSPDGQYVAYSTSKGGSDWREARIREVASGKDLDDHLQWIKFSGFNWDKEGFYYGRYAAPKAGDELSGSNQNQQLYYHRLNTPQEDDRLVYADPKNPKYMFSLELDKDFRYEFLYTSSSTNGNTFAFRPRNSKGDFVVADPDFSTNTVLAGVVDGKIWVYTNYEAPRYRLMAFDPAQPEQENWSEILPESKDVLKGVKLTKDYLLATYMVDVSSRLRVFDKKGSFLSEVELPGLGSVGGIQPVKDQNQFYFTFTSYTTPAQVLSYNIENAEMQEEFVPQVDFNPEDYTYKMVFVEAQDGAQVPLSIVHKKGLELNGQNPTLLYGYGGFNVVYSPRFDVRLLPWLENGGIYVNAHIRGGGEYGEDWYRAGTLLNKQRVFDDFILAAEHLIEQNYTQAEKLAIYGGSNGGLLVGAVANQRPELFQVALPAVGVMDMLRYQHFTIGWAWAGDYGRSDDSEEMFRYLYAYSPLHNIPEGSTFPATLVTTADHDDRVVPAHSFKYTAALQEKYKGSNPVLIRIETKAGHGAGKPLSMQIDEVADRWAFALFNMKEVYKK